MWALIMDIHLSHGGTGQAYGLGSLAAILK